MNDDLSLLVTLLDEDTMELMRVAIKIPHGLNEFKDWKNFRELDVHQTYSEFIPEMNIGKGRGIMEVVEIYDVVCENNILA